MFKIDVNKLPKLQKKDFPLKTNKKVLPKPIIAGGSVASYAPVRAKTTPDVTPVMNKYKNIEVGKSNPPYARRRNNYPL